MVELNLRIPMSDYPTIDKINNEADVKKIRTLLDSPEYEKEKSLIEQRLKDLNTILIESSTYFNEKKINYILDDSNNLNDKETEIKRIVPSNVNDIKQIKGAVMEEFKTVQNYSFKIVKINDMKENLHDLGMDLTSLGKLVVPAGVTLAGIALAVVGFGTPLGLLGAATTGAFTIASYAIGTAGAGLAVVGAGSLYKEVQGNNNPYKVGQENPSNSAVSSAKFSSPKAGNEGNAPSNKVSSKVVHSNDNEKGDGQSRSMKL